MDRIKATAVEAACSALGLAPASPPPAAARSARRPR
jgi:hypothetical protein